MKNEKNLEIEKKYLISVEKAPFNLEELEKTYIEQSYISITPTIRVRKYGHDNILTIKTKKDVNSKIDIAVSNEVEMFLNDEEYNNLIGRKLEHTRTLKKNRYFYKLNDKLTVEIDEYMEDFKGLVVAEIEFSSIEEAEQFEKPNWLIKDVTSNSNFINAVMAKTTDIDEVFYDLHSLFKNY